jgi:Oligosaccharyltransferase 48 kDa subunit beta
LNPKLIDLKNHNIIVTKNAINVPVVSTKPKGFILYEGIGMEVDSHSQYLFTILKGDDNTYSINTKTNNFYGFGERVKLVTGYQARNNRRVVISGSINLCSNAFYYLRYINYNK